jgi:2',3'-cyclic-nucleotide 2'-phosphodiesterase (5'-nucleotidase family)
MPSVSSITSSTFLTRLRIVSINDVYELANLPRLQTYLTKLSPKPSAVVLAGDFLSPSTLSSIDGGRGMVATLRAVGMTHVSLGNHEQDLRLDSLRQRLEDLSRTTSSSSTNKSNSKSNKTTTTTTTVVLNSNMQKDLPPKAEWMRSVTKPYSLVESPCGNVKVRVYVRCVRV